MKNIRLLFILFIAITVLSSCRKDSFTTEIEMNPPTPETNIETAFSGFVTDSSGEPIVDATVKILNQTTITNELGFFELTGLVNAKFAVLSIQKYGYFDQYKTITPSKTAINRIRVQLIERTSSGSFAATAGGTIAIGMESSVTFQANSIVDENGNIYSGQVDVYTFFIDPTDNHIEEIMPGNLMAINAEEEINILQSFGMVNVELEGQSGQKLNINKAATLEVAVPTALANDAPASIPLWYFNETNGLWVEEGSANLENGKYIGDVNHFTFWNCDVPYPLTFVNGQIFDARGVSLSRVRITDLSTGASFTEWTDSEGFFSGGVPQGVNLLLEVLGFCGNEVLFSAEIGPFTEETADLGIFQIINNARLAVISGTFLNCDQAPVTNGRVFFKLPSQGFTQQTSTDVSGNFSALVPVCEGEVLEIRGLDLMTDLVSQPLSVLPTGASQNIGSLELCTDVSASLGSVLLNFDGQEKTFDNCVVTVTDNGGGGTNYLFNYHEIVPGTLDTIAYGLIVTNLTSDLNNPSWTGFFFYYSPPSDNSDNELYYIHSIYFQAGVGSITVNQAAENTGDLLTLDFNNITVIRRINDPTGPNIATNFTGSSVRITGVIQ